MENIRGRIHVIEGGDKCVRGESQSLRFELGFSRGRAGFGAVGGFNAEVAEDAEGVGGVAAGVCWSLDGKAELFRSAARGFESAARGFGGKAELFRSAARGFGAVG